MAPTAASLSSKEKEQRERLLSCTLLDQDCVHIYISVYVCVWRGGGAAQ